MNVNSTLPLFLGPGQREVYPLVQEIASEAWAFHGFGGRPWSPGLRIPALPEMSPAYPGLLRDAHRAGLITNPGQFHRRWQGFPPAFLREVLDLASPAGEYTAFLDALPWGDFRDVALNRDQEKLPWERSGETQGLLLALFLKWTALGEAVSAPWTDTYGLCMAPSAVIRAVDSNLHRLQMQRGAALVAKLSGEGLLRDAGTLKAEKRVQRRLRGAV